MQLAGLLDRHYRARIERRNVSEKWRQMQAAKELEKHWRKAEILEAYLNLAPFRGELTGIDAASRGLFDKRPAGLNNSEATILVLIRSPNAKLGRCGASRLRLCRQEPLHGHQPPHDECTERSLPDPAAR